MREPGARVSEFLFFFCNGAKRSGHSWNERGKMGLTIKWDSLRMNEMTINGKEKKSEETLLAMEIWGLIKVLNIWGTKRIWGNCEEPGSIRGRGPSWVCVSPASPLSWPGFLWLHHLAATNSNTPLRFYSALELTVFSLIYIPCNPHDSPVKYGVTRLASLGMRKQA